MVVLENFKDDLLQTIDDGLNLIRTVNKIISITDLPVNLNVKQRDTIVEWTFVNLHSAWENFQENCFLTYMLGKQTASGFAPTRYVYPNDEQHALDIISGGREFFRWSSPSLVKTQSNLCFKDGEPFAEGLDLVMKDLEEMNTIRNAVVHKSRRALDKFKSLVRDKLLTAPLGITPGYFLLTIKPRTVRTTYLGHYYGKLRVAAKKIVPS